MASTTLTVKKITSREVTTRFGKKTTYSFLGSDGSWYAMSFNKPAFNDGATIKFDFNEGTYGKEVVKGSIKLASSADVSPIGKETTTHKSAGKVEKEWVFPIPPLDWQRNVIRTNAIHDAVAYYNNTKNSISAETIIELAKRFEAYAAGDLDQEEALKELNNAKSKQES